MSMRQIVAPRGLLIRYACLCDTEIGILKEGMVAVLVDHRPCPYARGVNMVSCGPSSKFGRPLGVLRMYHRIPPSAKPIGTPAWYA